MTYRLPPETTEPPRFPTDVNRRVKTEMLIPLNAEWLAASASSVSLEKSRTEKSRGNANPDDISG